MTKAHNNLDEDETEDALSQEEQLEAILFEFTNLYDRWSEDRQVAAKQGADIAKFVKEFAQQVGQFTKLESKVRDDIHQSIHAEAKNIATFVGRSIGDVAIKEVEPTVQKLQRVTDEAERALSRYQASFKYMHLEVIGAIAVSCIVLSLLIVWFLMPKPTLPLTDYQIKVLRGGELMNQVWPKLTKAEQDHWIKLADEVDPPGAEQK